MNRGIETCHLMPRRTHEGSTDRTPATEKGADDRPQASPISERASTVKVERSAASNTFLRRTASHTIEERITRSVAPACDQLRFRADLRTRSGAAGFRRELRAQRRSRGRIAGVLISLADDDLESSPSGDGTAGASLRRSQISNRSKSRFLDALRGRIAQRSTAREIFTHGRWTSQDFFFSHIARISRVSAAKSS